MILVRRREGEAEKYPKLKIKYPEIYRKIRKSITFLIIMQANALKRKEKESEAINISVSYKHGSSGGGGGGGGAPPPRGKKLQYPY